MSEQKRPDLSSRLADLDREREERLERERQEKEDERLEPIRKERDGLRAQKEKLAEQLANVTEGRSDLHVKAGRLRERWQQVEKLAEKHRPTIKDLMTRENEDQKIRNAQLIESDALGDTGQIQDVRSARDETRTSAEDLYDRQRTARESLGDETEGGPTPWQGEPLEEHLHGEIMRLDARIRELDLQTPEGREKRLEEIRERARDRIGGERKATNFRYQRTHTVAKEDIVEAREFGDEGPQIVKGAIQEVCGDFVAAEFTKDREQTGLAGVVRDFDTIKGLSERYSDAKREVGKTRQLFRQAVRDLEALVGEHPEIDTVVDGRYPSVTGKDEKTRELFLNRLIDDVEPYDDSRSLDYDGNALGRLEEVVERLGTSNLSPQDCVYFVGKQGDRRLGPGTLNPDFLIQRAKQFQERIQAFFERARAGSLQADRSRDILTTEDGTVPGKISEGKPVPLLLQYSEKTLELFKRTQSFNDVKEWLKGEMARSERQETAVRKLVGAFVDNDWPKEEEYQLHEDHPDAPKLERKDREFAEGRKLAAEGLEKLKEVRQQLAGRFDETVTVGPGNVELPNDKKEFERVSEERRKLIKKLNALQLVWQFSEDRATEEYIVQLQRVVQQREDALGEKPPLNPFKRGEYTKGKEACTQTSDALSGLQKLTSDQTRLWQRIHDLGSVYVLINKNARSLDTFKDRTDTIGNLLTSLETELRRKSQEALPPDEQRVFDERKRISGDIERTQRDCDDLKKKAEYELSRRS